MADLNIFARWHGADVKKGVDEAKSAFAQLKAVTTGAFAGIGAAAVVNELKNLYKEAAADVTIAQKLGNELRRFGATESDIRRVKDQIQSLTLSTGIADDQIATAFRRLLVATKSETEALKWLPLALDLAADRGMDAASAADAMAMASQGFILRLSRMLPDIRALSKANSDLEGTSAGAAEAFRVLSAAFGGKAAENANTASGALERLANAWGEAREEFGRRLFDLSEQNNQLKQTDDQLKSIVASGGSLGGALRRAFLVAFEPLTAWQAFVNWTESIRQGNLPPPNLPFNFRPSPGGVGGATTPGSAFGFGVQAPSGAPDYMKWDPESGTWLDLRILDRSRFNVSDAMKTAGMDRPRRKLRRGFGQADTIVTDEDVSQAERLAKILEQPYEMAEANRKLAAEELQQLEDSLANSIGNAFMAAGGGVRSFARAIEQEVFRAIVRAISRALAGQIASAILGVSTGGVSKVFDYGPRGVSPITFGQKQQAWRMQRGM